MPSAPANRTPRRKSGRCFSQPEARSEGLAFRAHTTPRTRLARTANDSAPTRSRDRLQPLKSAVDGRVHRPQLAAYEKSKLAEINSPAPVPEAFVCDNEGKVIKDAQANIRLAVKMAGVRFSYNEFINAEIVEGPGNETLREVEDKHIRMLWGLIDRLCKFRPTFEVFNRFCHNFADENPFHPVRDYLGSLTWDGVRRLDEWLIVCAKAEDTPYVRAVSRLILVAAARRILQPGCKFDEMLILEGDQGTDKSSGLKALVPDDNWFSEISLHGDDRQLLERLDGVWIAEIDELVGMKQSDIERVKSVLSRNKDKARRAYAERLSRVKRQCVFFGTTNNEEYLRDLTGNRRFWPVKIQQLDTAKILEIRDQLWAEATVAAHAGESIRLHPSLWKDAAVEQAKRLEEDPWAPILSEALFEVDGHISDQDLLRFLKITPDKVTKTHTNRLISAMKSVGFLRVRRRFTKGDEKTPGFIRGATEREREKRIQIHEPMAGSGVEAPAHASYVTPYECERCKLIRDPSGRGGLSVVPGGKR